MKNLNLRDVFNFQNNNITKRMNHLTLVHIHEKVVFYTTLENMSYISYPGKDSCLKSIL